MQLMSNSVRKMLVERAQEQNRIEYINEVVKVTEALSDSSEQYKEYVKAREDLEEFIKENEDHFKQLVLEDMDKINPEILDMLINLKHKLDTHYEEPKI